ncbi:TonB-dependent receptor [candidate division WOR-3 bacterium]|nr:TonB-dependent receptor [candidate division WOR-3 bacterium]
MIPSILLLLLVNQQIYEMDEIVVTATRYPLALQNVAVATMVIDRADIDALRALDITEVLQGTAGLDVKDYGTPGAATSLMLRGVPSSGTLVLVNGQPVNMATTGMADISAIDVNSIERIEVVKGPVSSIYGANTLGGVVNVITDKEYTKPEIWINAAPFTTTFDTLFQNRYVGLAAGLPFQDWQLGLSAAYRTSLGHRSNSELAKYDIQGTIGYQTDRVALKAHMAYDDKDYGIPGPMPYSDSLHPVPVFGDSTATSLYDHQDDAALLGNIKFVWNVSERLQWEQRLYGDRRNSKFHTQYAGWIGDTIIEDHTYLTYSGGYNTMVLARFSGLDLSVGIDARIDSLNTQTASEQSGDTTWDASVYTFGGWCQAKKDIGDIVSFVPSLRLDYHGEYGTFLSPSIGFITIVQPKLVLKASVGRTFRAPGLNDLYWPLSGNRGLTPEYGWVYEMRVEAAPLHAMFGAVSLFMHDIKDRIAWMPDTGGMWMPQNINELSIIGLDCEYQGRLTRFVDLALQGTYVTAIQMNDEIVYDFYDYVADTSLTIIQEIERDAAYIPRYTLKFTQHLHAPCSFDIDLSEMYVSETRNYYTNYDRSPAVSMDEKIIDAYMLFNASVTKTFGTSILLTAGVKNALNTDYATQFGYSIDDLDYPMPGRTYFLNISAHY